MITITDHFFGKYPSKYQLEELLLHLHHHPDDFQEVFNLVSDTDPKRAFRALWACEKVSQRTPEWFSAQQQKQIRILVKTTCHIGIHRLCLSTLYAFANPEPIDIELLNALYEWMLSPKMPPGNQSYAMRLLHKLVKDDPDLMHEFQLVLEQSPAADYSPAFQAARAKILSVNLRKSAM